MPSPHKRKPKEKAGSKKHPLDRTIFYTDHKITTNDGKVLKIRNIGLAHGVYLTLPKNKQKAINSLTPKGSTVISEGSPKHFLPEHLATRFAPQHHSEAVSADLAEEMIGKKNLLILSSINLPIALSSEIGARFRPVKIVNGQIGKKQLAKVNDSRALRPFISKKYKPEDTAFFVTPGRSALMASDLLAAKDYEIKEPLVSVSGIAHSHQIARFLENPKLHYRYLKKLKAKVDAGRIPDTSNKELSDLISHRLRVIEGIHKKESWIKT